ncbi:hypothetical protein N7490_008394 [Penicillium lividum]|nr:hypothetical protein N7490_008394 [Penicillium lividum]
MESTLLHAWNAEKEAGADAGSKRLDRNEMIRKIQTYMWNDDFEANGRTLFVEHNEHGWESLCRFLRKEIPVEEFPRKDDWVKYKEDVKVEVERNTNNTMSV